MLAIDLGQENIKVVSFVRQKGKWNPEEYKIIEVPGNLFVGRKSKDKNAIRKKIENCFEKPGFKSGILRIALPRCSGRVMVMDFPAMKKKELKNAVKWEMARYLPFSPEETIIDYKTLGDKKGKTKVVAAGVSLELFKTYTGFFTNFKGRKIDRITLSPAALLFPNFQGEKNQVKIDWGAGGATLIYFSKGNPVLVRSLEGPGLAQKDFHRTEREKFEGFSDLAAEIERALFHIPEEESSSGIKKIEISGGNSLAQGFRDYLEERLKIPVVFPEKEFFPGRRERSLLAVAMGLGKLGGRKRWKDWIFPGI